MDDCGTVRDGIQTWLLRKLGFRTAEMKKYLGAIPFEAFLQVLLENHMPLDTFSRVFQAHPTNMHHLIAHLIRLGLLSRIGTTNFDICLESAMQAVGIPHAVVRSPADLDRLGRHRAANCIVFKLHGSIDQLDDMGITIRSIAQKRNLDARRKIAEAFFGGIRTVDTLLVLGYSCSDVFDLATWVPQISRRLTVIYINHRTGKRIANTTSKGDNARARRMFHGHILHIVDCDTDSLARAIGRHLGFSFALRRSPSNSWRETLRECIRDFTGFKLAKTRGNLYYVFQDYEKSFLCHQESFLQARSDLERLIATRNIGFSHYRQNRINEALSVMRNSLRLARRVREHVHEANILMNIASCYADKGRYSLSHRYYMDALSIAEYNRLLREKCFILGNMGLMHAYAGRYKDSLKYTRKGISLARQLGEVETEGKFHANVGETYLNAGQWRRAMQPTRIAINIARDIGDTHGEVNRKTNLLTAELKSGTKDMRRCLSEALVLLQQSVDIGNDLYAANCHQLIGDCHLAGGDTPSAIAAWKKASLIYDKAWPSKAKHVLRKIRRHAAKGQRGHKVRRKGGSWQFA